MGAPIDAVIEKVRSTYVRWGRDTSVAQMRADWDALFGVAGSPSEMQFETIDGVPAAWIGAADLLQDRVFIYLHGGGYQVGSIVSHFVLARRISAASGIRALSVEYRLAPEHRFPAPIEDSLAVYRHLLARGIRAEHVAIVGDSAGGNLALATVSSLKAAGLPLPGAIAVLSPWTDLTASGASYETRADADPIHHRKMILRMAGAYLGSASAEDPLASPLKADLTGFPPVMIQVGDRETVLDDARDLAARLQDAGVEVRLQVWDGMIHVFQQFPDHLPEAREAIGDLGEFLGSKLGRA
jgi:monoterpene epsilon-lactone hydrolase